MSLWLTTAIVLIAIALIIIIGGTALDMAYDMKQKKYKAAYIAEHGACEDFSDLDYADEKLKEWSLYNLWSITTDNRTEDLFITCILLTCAVLFLSFAHAFANKGIDALAEKREKMAQDAVITHHVDKYDIASYNLEVIAAYNEVPNIDRKLFLGDEKTACEKLLIPYDNTWYTEEVTD